MHIGRGLTQTSSWALSRTIIGLF